MPRKFCAVVLLIVAATALLRHSAAEDGGWKLPNLNPFSTTTKPPTSGRVSSPPTSGLKMPKVPNLLPQTTAKPARKSNQPTTWKRMTSGTQNLLNKTADALTPWDNNKKLTVTPNITGSNTAFTRSSNGAKKAATEKSGSVLPASWWGSEKRNEPKTVNDFLSQPRPQ
jgi:hypothetical protein